MREILFKAKRIDNGEWVEGHLIQTNYFGSIRSWISSPNDKTRLRAVATYYCDWRGYEVNTDTICQYTGLTDKNGNKIWENDNIVCKQYLGGNLIEYHVEIGYVEMKYGAFGIHRKQGYYRPFKDWLEGYDYEVIGNIFDNPELLKGE